MSEESASGQAVAERVRAANIAVGEGEGVEAMLANSLRERKPLADDGSLYDTVQAAENAASSFVFVPPGTFNESVTIDTAGLTLLGSGRATLINGLNIDHAIEVNAANVTVENLSVQTTSGGGANYDGVNVFASGTNSTIKCVTVRDSDDSGIQVNADDVNVSNCFIEACDGRSISVAGVRVIVSSCHIDVSSGGGDLVFDETDDGIIENNVQVSGTANNGIYVRNSPSADCIVIGNRVANADTYGIIVQGDDNIVANNRVSDSGNTDVSDQGTGTTLDANLTGTSN